MANYRFSYSQSRMQPPFWIIKDGTKRIAEVWDEDAAKRIVAALADGARLDWLQEQIVDTIYLDDGQIIDVQGNNVRQAIDDKRMALASTDRQTP